jgi:hypothetical protein
MRVYPNQNKVYSMEFPMHLPCFDLDILIYYLAFKPIRTRAGENHAQEIFSLTKSKIKHSCTNYRFSWRWNLIYKSKGWLLYDQKNAVFNTVYIVFRTENSNPYHLSNPLYIYKEQKKKKKTIYANLCLYVIQKSRERKREREQHTKKQSRKRKLCRRAWE